MVIPDRFRRAVRTHLARLDGRDRFYRHLSAPRILCIEGPPGVGKSAQLARCLRDLGSAFLQLDTSQLGGRYESEPARALDEAVGFLKENAGSRTRPTLVIDDLDMSLGVIAERSYTVNTQLTSGWLMAAADCVYAPGFEASDPAIIVTGNDFSGLHRPLLRSGRARLMRYSPTPEEAARILGPIFGLHVRAEPRPLVEDYPGASIADFLEAISSLRDGWLERAEDSGADLADDAVEAPLIEESDLRGALDALARGAR